MAVIQRDVDPQETQEWLEALEAVLREEGPDRAQQLIDTVVWEARGSGAQQVELCTAEYAELTLAARSAHGDGEQKAAAEVERIRKAAVHAKSLGLMVAAGHGLTYRNVGALAAIPEITEFNIGHNIISRSVFVGLNRAVREMIDAIRSNSTK